MGKAVLFFVFLIILTFLFIKPILASQGYALRSYFAETPRTSIFTSKINQLLPEPQAGLLNGILFGEKAQMDKRFFDQLRRTGTLHAVALSGMNISILISLIGQISLIFGRRKSIFISFITIMSFIWFVGASASVVRAGLMGSLTLLSIWTGRKDWALLSLCAAAGIMLIFNRAWLFDLGFQLSFLATLGIITISSQSNIGNKSNKGITSGVGSSLKVDLQITLAAQLFTLPVLLYNFGSLSLIAPLTNVLVLWTIAPMMALGLLMSIFSIISLALATPLAWILWVPLTYFVKVIEITSQIPFASISF